MNTRAAHLHQLSCILRGTRTRLKTARNALPSKATKRVVRESLVHVSMLRLFLTGRPVAGFASTRLFQAESTMQQDTLPQLRQSTLPGDYSNNAPWRTMSSFYYCLRLLVRYFFLG